MNSVSSIISHRRFQGFAHQSGSAIFRVARRAGDYVRYRLACRNVADYRSRVIAHASSRPQPDQTGIRIANAIEQEGCIAIPVQSLACPGTGALLTSVEQLFEVWRPEPARGTAARPTRQMLDEFPDIYLWGLQEPLLDLAEYLIGLPPLFVGTDFKCELTDGRTRGLRQWHLDCEDHRVFKIILYLSDVSAGGGPFDYLPLKYSEPAARALRYRSGYVSDDVMARHVPPGAAVSVTAPKHHAILFDGAAIFHRAQPPTAADRYSVTFGYMSRAPLRLRGAGPTPRLREQIMPRLSARQLACLRD